MAALKRRQANPEHRNDMVEHWKTTLARHPQRMTITDLHATATGTVGAGADTISGALQSFVYHTLRKPQYLKKLQEEIAAEQAQGRCKDAVVSYADAANMEYLQACVSNPPLQLAPPLLKTHILIGMQIKESLRMFGPVPFGLARQAPEGGLKIGDRFFPKGV
jgi:cytochrome P450